MVDQGGVRHSAPGTAKAESVRNFTIFFHPSHQNPLGHFRTQHDKSTRLEQGQISTWIFTVEIRYMIVCIVVLDLALVKQTM